MKQNTSKKIRSAGIVLYSVLAVFIASIPSCSKGKNVYLSVSEPTELEKDSEISGLLQKTSGVYPVWGDGELVSATIIQTMPICAKYSRGELQATQQAAVWLACSEFVRFESSKVESTSNSAAEEITIEETADRTLSGVHVVMLYTDTQKQEVKAILRWKAPPWTPQIGTLPEMRFTYTAILSSYNKSERFVKRIAINGVVVINNIVNLDYQEDDKAKGYKMKYEYAQFFKNGEPHLNVTFQE
jgi:hypothetical protein